MTMTAPTGTAPAAESAASTAAALVHRVPTADVAAPGRRRRGACAGPRRCAASCARRACDPGMLVAPLFVRPGAGVRERDRVDARAVTACRRTRRVAEARAAGRRWASVALLLFGLPEAKDAEGTGAWAAEGIVQEALRAGCADADLPLVAHRGHVPVRVHRPRPLRARPPRTARWTTTAALDAPRRDRRRPGARPVPTSSPRAR